MGGVVVKLTIKKDAYEASFFLALHHHYLRVDDGVLGFDASLSRSIFATQSALTSAN
jgi:hypothetical protein